MLSLTHNTSGGSHGRFFGFNNNDEAAKKAAAEKAAAEKKAKEPHPQNAITGYAGMSAMQRREKEAGLAAVEKSP